ncbi:MAG: molybdate transporter substrate-binding protein [Phycisphaerales bacterium]|nr:molybdate transporter substrate-binding protein [Phycisphaerales bacterium]
MKHALIRLVVLSAVLLGVPTARADSIRVGAAVSLKEAFGEIATLYKADTGETVEFVFGSSGQVAAQIKSGAPMDAFVSAAKKQFDDLVKDGLLDVETRHLVAGNELVLIVPAAAVKGGAVGGFDDLKKDAVAKIAVGEPKTVPAGQYAAQTLKALKLDDAVKGKIVFGANVRQVLAYVERGEVQAGIVYRTDAKESGDKVTIVATADAATHEAIIYPAAVLSKTEHGDAAGHFLDYLMSEKAVAVMRAKGFSIPTDPAPAAPAKPATP